MAGDCRSSLESSQAAPAALRPTLPDGARWPRISLITPSFNQASFLEDALRSALDQAYPELEYIVIDGGSSDGSVDLLDRYADRLAYVCSEPDRGQSHAINKGFARATGEVFGWLCGDDLLVPGTLWRVGHHFATHPDCRWLSGAGEFVNLGNGDRRIRPAGLADRDALLRYWRYGEPDHYLAQPSTFWHRDLWEGSGGLIEAHHLAMDYDLWLRFQERANLHVIDDVLSISRLHAACKTVASRREQVREMMRCAYQAAKRRGVSARRLNVGLMGWTLERHLRRGKLQVAGRCWRGAWYELRELVRHVSAVGREDGRLDVFNFG